MGLLCKEKHALQTDPKQLAPAITNFHSKLLRVCRRGVYQTINIANMDQTPLLFVCDDGKTYANKGSSEVWCVPGSSVLEKRQCSVQLTIFADGVPFLTENDDKLKIIQRKKETIKTVCW